MNAFMLYRSHSDHARAVETFIHDFKSQTNREIELIDMDTREGDYKAQMYGIMKFPALVAVREDGEMLIKWDDPMLPRIQEVSAYVD